MAGPRSQALVDLYKGWTAAMATKPDMQLEELGSLLHVAQDGMRVRADAGAASFRRQASLEQHLAEAGELVRALEEQARSDPGQGTRKAQAAKLARGPGTRAAHRRGTRATARSDRDQEVQRRQGPIGSRQRPMAAAMLSLSERSPAVAGYRRLPGIATGVVRAAGRPEVVTTT